MAPLNIALLAPLAAPMIAPHVGGAQVLLHDLSVGLARRGHRVTLFAAHGSRIPDIDNLHLVECDPGVGHNLADFAAGEQRPAGPFFSQGSAFLSAFLAIDRGGFDLIHAHAFDWPVFALAALCRTPTLHTLHLPCVDRAIAEVIRAVYRATGKSHCVAVSRACAESYAEHFPFDAIIPNGVDVEAIPFSLSGEDHLIFVGRMSPEKGADKAIDIALRAGRKLILVGGIYDRSYHDNVIAPRLAAHPDLLDYRGVLPREEVWNLMTRSAGLLFTSRWEAFGLVLAEAQAAGVPAIAFDQGATREIVVPGETGFIVPLDDVAAAVEAVKRLDAIDRATCRRRIMDHFSLEAMLTGYERHYHAILGRG
jgi:glycosyltransferase involved in cell wall biosynthesis